MADYDDIPEWLWPLIDRDGVLREALNDVSGAVERYTETWSKLLLAASKEDDDAIDELLAPLKRDELMLMIVTASYAVVEYFKLMARRN